MEGDPPPELAPQERPTRAELRALARCLLAEMARYDEEMAAKLHERHIRRLRRSASSGAGRANP